MGRSMCLEHNKRRDRCVQCWTLGRIVPNLCVHGRQKDQCVECLPLEMCLKKRNFCSICGVTHVKTHRTMCVSCEKTNNMRMEVRFMADLAPLLTHPCSGNITLGGDGCKSKVRRPDGIWIGPDSCVILELDEGRHASYQSICEIQRLQEMHYALQHKLGSHYVVNCLHVGLSKSNEYSLELVQQCADTLNAWFVQPPQSNSMVPGTAFINYSKTHKHVLYAQAAADAVVFIPLK